MNGSVARASAIFVVNADACQKKYENQPLIITGKLDQLDFPEDTFATVTLAAPTGARCRVGPLDQATLRAAKLRKDG